MGKRVVWVLGAGFSVPLGGPLLATLLSGESAADLAIRYPDAPRLHDESAQWVRVLYAYGSGPGESIRIRGKETRRERMWRDPEEFLDYLDTAAATTNGPHAQRLAAIARTHSMQFAPENLRHSARRLMGAECCSFLHEVDTAEERWQPFIDWAGALTDDDTVITFNYDRVIEMCQARRTMVILPGSDQMGEAKAAKCCPILKLHGSVDWAKPVGTGGAVRREGPTFVISAPDDAIAIATPGPTKRKTAQEFRDLWKHAKNALSAADAIVFIGYRFPPSDAEARHELLSAIGNSTVKDLTVHVVLGLPGPDAARLEALLGFACRSGRAAREGMYSDGARGNYAIRTQPLYGQDFLSVVQRAHLFE